VVLATSATAGLSMPSRAGIVRWFTADVQGVGVVVCPQGACGSPNVVDLPHYWQSLPAESPLKARYAPPAGGAASYWASVAVVVLGIVTAASGAVGLGLVVIVAAVGWGAFVYRKAAEATSLLEQWHGSQVCLACTRKF
jgi:hypothetical protein